MCYCSHCEWASGSQWWSWQDLLLALQKCANRSIEDGLGYLMIMTHCTAHNDSWADMDPIASNNTCSISFTIGISSALRLCISFMCSWIVDKIESAKTSATLAHLGYYKKMNLCSRSDIREDDKAVILEQNICRRLFCNDPVRQSLIEGWSNKEEEFF